MTLAQPCILEPIPDHSRYLCFNLIPGTDTSSLHQRLQHQVFDPNCVVGLGASLVGALNSDIAGLRPAPSYSFNGIDIASTPHALWVWLRGSDRGELLHQSRRLIRQLAFGFSLESATDGFKYGQGLDLTGYEDGTENPEGEAAIEAAFSRNPTLQGSSFVAVQQWFHDMDRFEAMPQQEQDHSIGRRLSDNEELDDAPESAHVKRTAQESFEPEAFILRRSMPWADHRGEGLMFVAFGHSFEPFEAQLERMIGLEDGISDALFQFSHPHTNSYYWCPAINQGLLELGPLEQ
ncbi:MAG: Dyp-type peroxidase [Halopseudomonas sp.]